jgi:hypothetical protein
MKKFDLFILYVTSLALLSINLIFQKAPGYMDTEYYFLGGRQIIEGDLSLPVIWNYLDDPETLPHPLFSYWMPFASLLSGLSMLVFGSTFMGSRILLLLLASGLAPFTYYVSHLFKKNRFVNIISGSLAILSGFYFKLLTIPETVSPYIFLGTLFIIFSTKLLELENQPKTNTNYFFILGIITGFLHLSRVDGFIFFIFGLLIIFIKTYRDRKRKNLTYWLINLFVFVISYSLIMSWWFINNINLYQSLFSPATSKAIWIATYDDTFIYPGSLLTFDYWIEYGLELRINQIIVALKLNFGTLLGVQLMIVGLPLFFIGIKRNIKKTFLRIGILHLLIILLIMTFIFPLAGSRGGFLHATSANQIILWIIVADGLQGFLEWGGSKRNWKLIRSQKMFGSAFILIIFIFTFITYKNDVIGINFDDMKWQNNYQKYEEIEKIISTYSQNKQDVIMINNPLGYHYTTDRWSVVIPNSEQEKFLELVKKYNVKFIVLDENLPEKFTHDNLELINGNFLLINDSLSKTKIYEYSR